MTKPAHVVVNNPYPAEYAEAVTPHDTTELSPVPRSLYIGTGGNVVVTMEGGGDVTFKNVSSGSILPIRVTKVKNASTTAQNIVALY